MKNKHFLQFNYIYTKWILLALILIAGIVRYIVTCDTSLDFEEQLLWYAGTHTNIVDSILFVNQLKPFSLILGWTSWLTCFNGVYMEIVSRAFSVISGILSVPLIFILARKFYSEVEGIIAASFVTFSWICINTSITISEHSLVLTFSIFFFISLITYLDSIAEDNVALKSEQILLTISGILLGLSSIWGIAIVVFSFFYSFFFITKINSFLKILQSFLPLLISMAMLVFFQIEQSITYSVHSASVWNYVDSVNYIISDNYTITIVTVSLLLYLLCVYLGRLFSTKEYGEDAKTKFHNSTLIASIWLVGSLIFFILITTFLHVKFVSKDLIFILPPFVILIARALVLITAKLKYQVILGVAFGFLIIASTLLNIENITSKPEYDQVFRYIASTNKTNSNENYSGICWTGMRYPNIPVEANTYYMKKNSIDMPIFSFDGKIYNIDKVLQQSKQQNLKYLWYVGDNSSASKAIIDKLIRDKKVTEGFRYKDVTLFFLFFS